MEQGPVGYFRVAHDDSQERDPNRYTLNAGDLCRSGLSTWKVASRRRDRLLCGGIAIAPAYSRPPSAMGIQESSGCKIGKNFVGIPDLRWMLITVK